MRALRKIAVACALAAGSGLGQTVINGSRQILGNWDASQATGTKAARQAATEPATCAEGEIYYNTTLHLHRQCTGPNTWADLGGGSEGAATVGLSMPAEFTVAGSPTSGGTITVDKAVQAANVVFAGPVSGSGQPGFRALATADLPARTTASYYQFVAAKCRSGTGITGLSLPGSNAPTPVCANAGSAVSGVLRFAAGTTQSAQDHFQLPPDWDGALEMQIAARSADAAHAAAASLQIACVGTGSIDVPAFQDAQTVSFTPGAGGGRTTANLNHVTTAGCTAGDELYFRVSMDATALASSVDLIGIRFTLWRTN